jgi:ABC-type Fe3+ transport system substrate-binding protein
MQRLMSCAAVMLVTCGLSGVARTSFAAAIDDLVSAAKREGAIEFYAPSTLTPQGAQALGAAFNKKYGLDVKLQYSPSSNMTKEIAKIIGQTAAGVAPEWDVMVVTDAHHASLWVRKLHKPFDYAKLGVEARAVSYDNGTVAVAHQIAAPSFNEKMVPAKDVPTSWDDLLDPKWKGRKLAASTATHHLARLAVGAWGEEKTTKYVQGLVKQDLNLGRMAEIYTRLLLGEVLLSLTLTDDFISRAKKTGAPIVQAEKVEPVIAPAYQIGVLKGAPRPNTGHLFALFMTTPEAQQIWEQFTGQASAFTPGSQTHKRLQGKQVVFMSQEQADRVDKLSREFGKMLGF